MDLWCPLLALCLISFDGTYAELNKLNDEILHYEPVHYDTTAFHEKHSRVKRSVANTLHLDFNALGRSFRLRLRRGSDAFAPDVEMENSDGSREPFDTSFMYTGELKGQRGSLVTGSVIEGAFRGVIHAPEDDYYLEPSAQHFSRKQPFHSIIYAGRHVKDLSRSKRAASHPHCGNADNRIREWMDKEQHSAVEDRQRRSASDSDSSSHQYHKYSAQANRQKRDVGNTKVCSLYMQADTMLWDYFDDGTKSEATIKQEISAVFQTHVTGIKNIYESTVFEYQNIRYSGITFSVQRIKINSTAKDCPHKSNTKNNPYCNPYIDVSNFLNLNSLTNHDDFCLAYIFTYRDFADGTLGLAWVGSDSKASGGICERYKVFHENDRMVKKSLNTGIVTFLNYGSRVNTKVSVLTFAHEVGHNFGSPHDFPAECTPFSKQNNPAGNFIMFASATSGDRENNDKFSRCSKENITMVLDAVLNEKNLKYNCFKSTGVAFCGNMIKEGNEECDCGYKGDCVDPCCNGRGTGQGLDCKLKTNAQCSAADACCDNNCKIRTQAGYSCRNETQCSQEQFCNGRDAFCPESEPKRNNTPCNSNTQVCKSGFCSGSICEKINWQECSVSVDLKPGETPPERKDLCFVSCREERNSRCFSTVDPNVASEAPALGQMLADINNNKGIQKPPGAHCDNMQGYCDVFHKCRGIDADGPLARLKNLIFNQATLNTIRDWITKHWWAVLLMGLGLIVFMGIFIKICAVHTPSSNPLRKPARPISLHRRPQPQRQPREPQPASSRPTMLPKEPPPPYGAPSAPTGGPPPGKGKKRQRQGQRYQASRGTDIELT